MNMCIFTGYLAEDPVLAKVDGVSYLDLKLVIYNYRRTKSTGEKSRTPSYLYFEAWHTGAETIAKLAQKGSKITVHASAKNVSRDDETVVFRINEFDLACIDGE